MDFQEIPEILENLILISNGSSGKLSDNIETWNKIPTNIKHDIRYQPNNYEKILFLAKNITSNLDLKQQEFLLDYMQRSWWRTTKDRNIAEILESIKKNINSNIQPRISWEVGLLKVKIKGL